MTSAPPDADLPAQRFARHLLGGGAVGTTLYGQLWAGFPNLDRDAVYFGVALAWTEMAAGRLAQEAEVADLRQRLAAFEKKAAA